MLTLLKVICRGLHRGSPVIDMPDLTALRATRARMFAKRMFRSSPFSQLPSSKTAHSLPAPNFQPASRIEIGPVTLSITMLEKTMSRRTAPNDICSLMPFMPVSRITQFEAQTFSMFVTASGPTRMAAQSELRMQLVMTTSRQESPRSIVFSAMLSSPLRILQLEMKTSWQPSMSRPSLLGWTLLSIRSPSMRICRQWIGCTPKHGESFTRKPSSRTFRQSRRRISTGRWPFSVCEKALPCPSIVP